MSETTDTIHKKTSGVEVENGGGGLAVLLIFACIVGLGGLFAYFITSSDGYKGFVVVLSETLSTTVVPEEVTYVETQYNTRAYFCDARMVTVVVTTNLDLTPDATIRMNQDIAQYIANDKFCNFEKDDQMKYGMYRNMYLEAHLPLVVDVALQNPTLMKELEVDVQITPQEAFNYSAYIDKLRTMEERNFQIVASELKLVKARSTAEILKVQAQVEEERLIRLQSACVPGNVIEYDDLKITCGGV